jgi:hypothetical protein
MLPNVEKYLSKIFSLLVRNVNSHLHLEIPRSELEHFMIINRLSDTTPTYPQRFEHFRSNRTIERAKELIHSRPAGANYAKETFLTLGFSGSGPAAERFEGSP